MWNRPCFRANESIYVTKTSLGVDSQLFVESVAVEYYSGVPKGVRSLMIQQKTKTDEVEAVARK